MPDVKKVLPGQSARRISAAEHNRIADVANRNGSDVLFTGKEFEPGTYIRVKLEDSYPRNQGEALRIYQIYNQGDQNNVRRPCAIARLPGENSQPVILVEPYNGRNLALALVSGVTECPVNVTSIYHKYARTTEFNTTLQSSVNGPVRILSENAAGTTIPLGVSRHLVQLSNGYDAHSRHFGQYHDAPELSTPFLVSSPSSSGVPEVYQEFTLSQTQTPEYELSYLVRVYNKVSYMVFPSPSGTPSSACWYHVGQLIEYYDDTLDMWHPITGTLSYGATQRYKPDDIVYSKETLVNEFKIGVDTLDFSGNNPLFRVVTVLVRSTSADDPYFDFSSFLPEAAIVSCSSVFTTGIHSLYPFGGFNVSSCPDQSTSDDEIDTTPVNYNMPGDFEYTVTTESILAEVWGPGENGGTGVGPTAGGKSGRCATKTITGLTIGSSIAISVAAGDSGDSSFVVDMSTVEASTTTATGDTTHTGGNGGAAGVINGGGGGGSGSPTGNGSNGQSGAAGGAGGTVVGEGGAGGSSPSGAGTFPGGGGAGKGNVGAGVPAGLGASGKVRITPIS